jgi:hypothetical protein
MTEDFFSCDLQHCVEWSRLPILHVRIYQSASTGINNPFEEAYHFWMEECYQYSVQRKVLKIKYGVTCPILYPQVWIARLSSELMNFIHSVTGCGKYAYTAVLLQLISHRSTLSKPKQIFLY